MTRSVWIRRNGRMRLMKYCFFFQAEDGIRDKLVTGVQTCALPIYCCAQAQTNAIIERLAHNSPTDKGWVANVLTLQDALVEEGTRIAVLLLMGLVVFVLLIACANVAGMFLARYAGRMTEFDVRAALGAGRLRLIQQLLTESLLFAIFGGAFGLLLSYWGVHLLRAKLSFNAETAWF